MNVILLSGGSGKRLWPLSNHIRSKQFLKMLKRQAVFPGEDQYESMIQRIYRQIQAAAPDADVTIATAKSQVSAIHNQLGDKVRISVEPCRRDTFAAIALATAYLHDIQGVDEDDAVVVCPVDPYVENRYFSCMKKMYETAGRGEKNLVLMGIKPVYPSEKYGYIKPSDEGYAFIEKPAKEKAEEYIAQGALWNGGVFAYKLSYVRSKSRELLGTDDYATLFRSYGTLDNISFDYAVAEQETSIEVVCYDGAWKDLGTWNTLTEAIDEKIIGDGMLDETSSNVHIINELGVPVLGMGLHDLVISASSEGILVSDKKRSSFIQPFVDRIDRQVMFAEKSWGSYRVLDVEEASMTVKVTLNPGHRMNYHAHERRREVWTVIAGNGKTIVDGVEQPVEIGDVVTMGIGCKHTVVAGKDGIQLIEVQMGREICVTDKYKYKMPC